jgi:peptide/nickel transport system substrate-binding protein
VFLAAAVLALGVLGPASARAGKYGGTIVVGLREGDPLSLDPTLAATSADAKVLPQMCLRLYEYADNHGTLELSPVLAAAPPEVSADGLTYTLRLRPGVAFNDGTPLTAQAVVASYQRYLTYPGSTKAGDFPTVAGVVAAGALTVVYHLKQRDSSFTGNMYVLSPTALAKDPSGFSSNPVCVGPFMFDHRVPGDNVTLVKSPYYYKRSAIHVDKLVFRPMPDGAAAMAALQAGDIQAVTAVPPGDVPGVRQSSGLRVLEAPTFSWNGIVVNIGNGHPGTPLASSTRLRQAFEEAIDRKALNKVVFAGENEPSCTMIPAADTLWFDSTSVPCTPYDPKDARRLVAASGFPSPTVHYLTVNSSSQLELAQFIQAQEAAVGINVVIDAYDSATYNARRGSGNFDTATGQSASDPEPNNLIYSRVATNAGNNDSGYSNPRLDYVLAEALKAAKLEGRAAYYRVAQQIIHDDRPIVVLYNRVTEAAYSTRLSGVQLNATGYLIFANAQFE